MTHFTYPCFSFHLTYPSGKEPTENHISPLPVNLVGNSPRLPTGVRGDAAVFNSALAKAGQGSWEEPLVLFCALLLMSTSCLVLIELLSLQHAHCGCHCLWASSGSLLLSQLNPGCSSRFFLRGWLAMFCSVWLKIPQTGAFYVGSVRVQTRHLSDPAAMQRWKGNAWKETTRSDHPNHLTFSLFLFLFCSRLAALFLPPFFHLPLMSLCEGQ